MALFIHTAHRYTEAICSNKTKETFIYALSVLSSLSPPKASMILSVKWEQRSKFFIVLLSLQI